MRTWFRATLTVAILLVPAAASGGAWTDWTYAGARVAYRVDGAGAPVVQVHGLGAGASSEQTKYQIAALVEAGHRVYSLDLTGWGRSIGPQRLFTGAYYAGLVTAFLDEVVAEPAALIGHSLGGTYAVAAAAARPELVTALVLNAPVGVESFTRESTPASARLWERFVTSEWGEALYGLLGSWPSISAFCRSSLYVDASYCDGRTLYDYWQYTQAPESIFAAGAFLTSNLGLDIRDELAALEQPILLIWGAENAFTPLGEADAFLAVQPSARLEVIEAAGAMVNDEQRGRFDQLTLQQIGAVVRAVPDVP